MNKIAHVGGSAEFDENDRWHMDAVFSWLYELDNGDNGDYKLLYSDNRVDDFIDLNDGRDFLMEDRQYDIVVLHMVYSPPDFGGRRQNGAFFTSRLHSPENWRRRLAGTGAKYIFTFGDYDEVSGMYLKHVPGYDGPIDAGNYLSVFVRAGVMEYTVRNIAVIL